MDFQTLSRRQLQALCKKNKIPANLTNVAMADSLASLPFVEGIEEIMNPSEFDLAAQSPMVPPTGGRSRAVKAETPGVVGATATRRRAAAASASVRKNIDESLDESEEVKGDVSVNTPAPAPASRRRVVREASTVKPVYSTRRSTRLAPKVEEPKEISEAIKISSFTEETDENVEVSVDQNEPSEISVVDDFKECSDENEVKSIVESEAISEETNDNQNGDVAAATTEQTIASDIETETHQEVVAQETKASIEDTEVNSNVGGEVEVASYEVTDMISNVTEEALSEKDTGMDSTVDEEPKVAFENSEMNTCVEEEPKAALEDSEMKPNVDEAPKAAFEESEMKPNVNEATDMDTKEEEETDIAELEGHMEEADKEEEPNDNETSDDVEDMSDDELVDEPVKNSGVEKLIQIPDDKENGETGRNAVLVKDTKKKQGEDYSMRQLIKKIKELEITKQQKTEAGKDGEDMMIKATARPALKKLSDNMMVE